MSSYMQWLYIRRSDRVVQVLIVRLSTDNVFLRSGEMMINRNVSSASLQCADFCRLTPELQVRSRGLLISSTEQLLFTGVGFVCWRRRCLPHIVLSNMSVIFQWTFILRMHLSRTDKGYLLMKQYYSIYDHRPISEVLVLLVVEQQAKGKGSRNTLCYYDN